MPVVLRLLAPVLLLAVVRAVPAAPLLDPSAGAASTPALPWHVVGLPGQKKPFTTFTVAELQGRRAVRIEADASYGDMVHRLAPDAAGALSWSWRVERPLAHSDLRRKSGDDSQVKVCVFFDEPMDRLSFTERQPLRWFRARASEPIPTATICYVWDAQLPAEAALDNPFTRRMRYLVVEGASAPIGRWLSERRDLAADFTRLFGAECPVVPAIVGVSIGADADNTRGHSVAYVGDLKLGPSR